MFISDWFYSPYQSTSSVPSILRNEVKGELELQSESKNILHEDNMRWDERERESGRGEDSMARKEKSWLKEESKSGLYLD